MLLLHTPARSSPAPPIASGDPRSERVVAERNNPPFSGRIYLHGSPGCAETNRQGEAPAHNPVPPLKAKDAESQTRRAPRLPRTARAVAGGSAPALPDNQQGALRPPPDLHQERSRHAGAELRRAPRRKRPLSRRRRRGPARRPVTAPPAVE